MPMSTLGCYSDAGLAPDVLSMGETAMHILVRLVQVNRALWGYLIWFGACRMHIVQPRASPAQRFAGLLEGLGSTYVKLGQGLGLHRELLPDGFIVALQKLQDHVASFPTASAIAEVEAAFARTIDSLFATFDLVPLAAGSIAQVHRARLHDGRDVIVKVRRPGLRRQIEEDLVLLRWTARVLMVFLPRLRAMRLFDVLDELGRDLHKEIDFRREATSIMRFAENFQNSPTIYIPGVVDELYSDAVLVQEMSKGQRIDDPAFLAEGPRLARALVDAFIQQFFVSGMFHADPHPGNLFVLADGRICMHDFGLVGFLDKTTRRNLAAFMGAFAQQDGDWLLDAFLDLGLLGGRPDRGLFRAGLEEIIQDYSRLPLRDWSFGAAFLRLARIGSAQNLRLPHQLLLMMRAVFLMESTVRHLDPEFNLVDGLFKRAQNTLAPRLGGSGLAELPSRLWFEALLAMEVAPASLHRFLSGLRAGEPRLDPTETEIGTVGTRIAYALLASAQYIGASILMNTSIGPRIGGVPLIAVAGYTLALWLTLRVGRRALRR